MTMKNSLILGLSLSLVACNCSDKAGGGAKGKAQSDTLAAMLTQMPSDDAGLVVAVHDVAGALAGLNVQVDRLAGAIDDPVKIRAAVTERFGFSPFDVAGWTAAGMDPSGGVGVWFGGEGKIEAWTGLVMVSVADKAKMLETAKRLAKREGAMDVGEMVAHEGGEWYPFQRTLGQRVTQDGGMWIKGKQAVFTTGKKEFLSRLGKDTKRLDKDALLKELSAQLPGMGQALVFGSRKLSVSQAATEGAVDKLQGDGWAAAVSATPQKLEMHSAAKSEGEALKELKRLIPEPLQVPFVPAGSMAAWQQSTDAKAIINLFAQTPQFAQALAQLETGLKQLDLDLHNDVLKPFGTTFSAWLGVGDNVTSPFMLIGTAFVGLDIAGGEPQKLIDTVKKVIEKAGAPIPGLTGLPNGFDFTHQMGKLKIRAEKEGNRLSVRFGEAPKTPLAASRPAAKDVSLNKDRASAAWIDFQALAQAAKMGGALAGQGPLAGIVEKVATALAQYDHLIATSGQKGAYQMSHGALVMKAPAAAK
jgi:hypothetical protein